MRIQHIIPPRRTVREEEASLLREHHRRASATELRPRMSPMVIACYCFFIGMIGAMPVRLVMAALELWWLIFLVIFSGGYRDESALQDRLALLGGARAARSCRGR